MGEKEDFSNCDIAAITDRSAADDGLVVKATTLPGCTFLGLFTNRHFEKNSLICKYKGTVLTTREAMRLEDKMYLMRLGEQCYIDAKDASHVFARYFRQSFNIYYIF
jgi:hypothetical protein